MAQRRRDMKNLPGSSAESSDSVVVTDLAKTFVPSPPMMRVLLRSALKEPVRALDGVSLQVGPGQICAVVGPNGAGKSTLFRILTGLITPTSGSASVMDYDVARESLQVRRLIGFHAADERMLLGRHSVAENLSFHGRLQGMRAATIQKRSREVLDLVGLERVAKRLALALSSGMKARLMLARALLPHPRVLILDEPTGSLDPVAAYEFIELIKATVAERGIATLISSHRLEEIEALPEHVLLLNEGRVIYDGDLDELRRYWDQPRIEFRFGSETAAAHAVGTFSTLEGVEVIASDTDTVLLATERAVGDLFAAANGRLDRVVGMSEVRMPLRDLLAKILVPSGNL